MNEGMLLIMLRRIRMKVLNRRAENEVAVYAGEDTGWQ
jgi:hypothetical protein